MTMPGGELGWAGLFFNAAASIFAGPTCVHLVIARKDLKLLFRFLEAVRMGRVVGPYESNKGIYYYRCTKKDEVYAMKELLWEMLDSETQKRWAEQDTILRQRVS